MKAHSPIFMGNIVYPTVEHAFQAAKTFDLTRRRNSPSLGAGEDG